MIHYRTLFEELVREAEVARLDDESPREKSVTHCKSESVHPPAGSSPSVRAGVDVTGNDKTNSL
jgi:hypothetical protein